MSSKWSMEADNEEIAKITMSLFFGKNIPIAVYSPKKFAFEPKYILEKNINVPSLKDKIQKCMDSIKEE